MVPNGNANLAVLSFGEFLFCGGCKCGSAKVALLCMICSAWVVVSYLQVTGNGELKVFVLSIGTTSA